MPRNWTVGATTLHATDTLSRGRTIYARRSATVTRKGPLAVRLHRLHPLSSGRYTLTVRVVGHGISATMRRGHDPLSIGLNPRVETSRQFHP